LVRLGIVLGHHRTAWHVWVCRIEQICYVISVFALRLKIVDEVEDSGLLDKLADGVDVQENSVSEQTCGREVPGPHLELILRNVSLIFLNEVLRKATDLLVVLRRKRVFHQDVKEV
jgi:hypothetical protein